MTEKALITTALIYANGPLHLGHIVEQIQADIWVRNKRMQGVDCVFISGDDAHGTPIMLSAAKQNITPEEMIKTIHMEHKNDSKDFLISYDYYDSTHNETNKEIVYDIYAKLKQQELIHTKNILQAYDETKGMFLPDRFIKGSCPKCGAKEQYGDNCEACGATYSPVDLIDPYSTLSNTKPTTKESEHYFFKLGSMQTQIEAWLSSAPIQAAVGNKLQEWLNSSLRDWDISRDAPYFGFNIPGADDKFFYVWLDAPIGYFGILKNYADTTSANINFAEYINPDSDIKMYHFIGKDITYFHGLFWPAMLAAAKYKLPEAIYAHGFLTVNGKKMSKSKGTFITARQYLDKLSPEYLRYYIATRLADGVDDLDLNWDEFTTKINSDLIGKVINIASRTSGFIHKKFDGKLSGNLDDENIIATMLEAKDTIIKHYDNRQYNLATNKIMQLADKANQYIANKEPWKQIKDPKLHDQVHKVCTTSINMFKIIITYLAPILPETAKNSMDFLNINSLDWQEIDNILLNHEIKPYKHLLARVDKKDIPTKDSPSS
jgi:methionyl-tRNA synthetase